MRSLSRREDRFRDINEIEISKYIFFLYLRDRKPYKFRFNFFVEHIRSIDFDDKRFYILIALDEIIYKFIYYIFWINDGYFLKVSWLGIVNRNYSLIGFFSFFKWRFMNSSESVYR